MRKKMRTVTTYECGVCGAEFKRERDALACEAMPLEVQCFKVGDRVQNVEQRSCNGRNFQFDGKIVAVQGPTRFDEEYEAKWLGGRGIGTHVREYLVRFRCPHCGREKDDLYYAPLLVQLVRTDYGRLSIAERTSWLSRFLASCAVHPRITPSYRRLPQKLLRADLGVFVHAPGDPLAELVQNLSCGRLRPYPVASPVGQRWIAFSAAAHAVVIACAPEEPEPIALIMRPNAVEDGKGPGGGRPGASRLRASEKPEDAISDGFGGIWSKICPQCNKPLMEVVRPGKVQCRNCG